MWIYAENILSSRRRVQLSSASILNNDAHDFLTKAGKNYFLIVVRLAEGAIWKTRMNEIMTGNFYIGPGLER